MSDGAWIIVFDDKDCAPEHFSGHGAEAAARARFAMLNTHWNVHLFERVASSLDSHNGGEAAP